MAAVIINGTTLAGHLMETISSGIAEYCRNNPPPCLAILASNTDPASQVYIRSKTRALEKAGMCSKVIGCSETGSEDELLDHIQRLNTDSSVDGILVQLPLPLTINTNRILAALDPEKDIDGFTPENLGKLLTGNPAFIPCTPQGILYMLQETGIPLVGAHAVIVGRSAIVGKPLAALLTIADATVTLCHRKTKNLAAVTRQADVLIVAAGQPACINGDMIKEGATVIDVGINRIPDPSTPKGYRLIGDVLFEEVQERAAFITPVPGGVGPLTVAMVLQNLLKAARQRRNR